MNANQTQLYKSVLHNAGFVDLSDRIQIEVTGLDHVSFLHSMISNDVSTLTEGHGRYATFLTATGKMIADFHFYKLADRILIDIAGGLADGLQESLERFVIMDEVEFTRLKPCRQQVAVHGPSAGAIVRQLCGQEPPVEQLQISAIQSPSAGWVINRPDILEQGFQVLLSEPTSASLREWFLEEEIPEISELVLETFYIEAFRPRFGVDMNHNNYPMEARLDEAISLTKGCYVGQEVVAKATNIGGVNRLLVGLEFLNSSPIPAFDSLLYFAGKKVGKLTSSCFSPQLQSPLALGYLRRNLAKEGVEIQVGSDSSSILARVRLESPSFPTHVTARNPEHESFA